MPRVLSRHRLPRRYRVGLSVLWLLPPLLILTLVLSRGFDTALSDPRLWLPLLLMTLPALYIWQEGVDVRTDGITARYFLPRFYPYGKLDTWYYDASAERRVITVWDAHHHKLLECRAAHLTQVCGLIAALHDHVHHRRFPR